MNKEIKKTYMLIDQLIPGVKFALKKWDEEDGSLETLEYIKDYCEFNTSKSYENKLKNLSFEKLIEIQKYLYTYKNKNLNNYIEKRKKFKVKFEIKYNNIDNVFFSKYIDKINNLILYIKEKTQETIKNKSIMTINFDEKFEFGLTYNYDLLNKDEYYIESFKKIFNEKLYDFTKDFAFIKNNNCNLLFNIDITLSNNDIRNDFSIKVKGNLINDIAITFDHLNINLLAKKYE